MSFASCPILRMKLLYCPSCGREVVVAKVERVLSAQSARCPYPECATVIVTVMNWSDEAPTVLYTHTEVMRVFRKKLLRALPGILVAQTILGLAIYAAGYAIQHVSEAPSPSSTVQSLRQFVIGLGACGLLFPSVLFTLVLIASLLRRVRNDRETLRRLTTPRSGAGQGFRLVPCPRTYRTT